MDGSVIESSPSTSETYAEFLTPGNQPIAGHLSSEPKDGNHLSPSVDVHMCACMSNNFQKTFILTVCVCA